MRHLLALPLFVALGVGLASPALAQDKPLSKTECLAAFEKAQSSRDAGKLIDARATASSCARPECPKAIAGECAQWVEDIGKSLPTVVLAAKGPVGEDLVDVEVTVDGAPLTTKLGARALEVDPGEHTFRFRSSAHGEAELKVVVREGEKNRTVSASFEKAAAGAGGAKPPSGAPSGAPAADGGGPPVAFWILGGAGTAAVITGVVFEIVGLSQKSDLDACKPSCAQEDADAMSRSFVIGDLAIAGGAVALAGALLVLITDDDEPASVGALTPIVAPTPTGGYAGVSVRF